MSESNLMKTYRSIQENYNGGTAHTMPSSKPIIGIHAYNTSNPKFLAYRNQILKEREAFTENCLKRILLDIYIKVLPFDDGYCDDNRQICINDIDAMLTDKKVTAMQYFESAYETTGAPLLEYVLRTVDILGQIFVEVAMESKKEADEAGVDLPPPKWQEEELNNAIVDITSDDEYETFIAKLKKKTINKLVDDISKLIEGEVDVKKMTFKPTAESSKFNIAYNYIIESALKAQIELPISKDEIIGLAIRESMLGTFDDVFRLPGADIKHFTTKIKLGNGVLINKESVKKFLAKGS